MIEQTTSNIPESHEIRPLFRALTECGMDVANVHDDDAVRYISNLLTEFTQTGNTCRVRDEHGQGLEYVSGLLAAADQASDPETCRDHHKHLADLTLSMLGLFPEQFERSRRARSAECYAEQGRRSYNIVAEMDASKSDPAVYRKLSDRFEQYVLGLNWVHLYINDPFFQYMFREFGIS